MTRQTKMVAIILTMVAALGIVIGLTLVVGQSVNTKERSVGDVIQHLERGGTVGVYKPLNGSHFGAKEGGLYTGDGFEVTIVLFEDQSEAERMERNGHYGRRCYRNGRFVLIGRKGEEKVLGMFKSF